MRPGVQLGAATSVDPHLQAHGCIRPSRCWVGGTPGPSSRPLSQEGETFDVSVLDAHSSSSKDPTDKTCCQGHCRHGPPERVDPGRAESWKSSQTGSAEAPCALYLSHLNLC